MLGVIPYHTFPKIGPFFTFGIFVGIAILVGANVAKRHLDRCGYQGEEVYNFVMLAAIVGIVGARVMWVVGNWSDYAANPLRIFAIWEGGLAFWGSFIFCIALGVWWVRRHRIWLPDFLDATGLALTIGMAIGRWGCISVGEHFGAPSKFLLAVRYDGGALRETVLGQHGPNPIPITPGMTFHNTAIYEMLWCFAAFGGLVWLRRRGAKPGVVAAVAGVAYSVGRFWFDTLRVNDHRQFGLTGAQFLCLAMFAVSLPYLFHSLRRPADSRPAIEPVIDADADAPARNDASDDAGDASRDDAAVTGPVGSAAVTARAGSSDAGSGSDTSDPASGPDAVDA